MRPWQDVLACPRHSHPHSSTPPLPCAAAQYDTTVDSLLDLNPQLQANPTLLPLGTELILYPECEL